MIDAGTVVWMVGLVLLVGAVGFALMGAVGSVGSVGAVLVGVGLALDLAEPRPEPARDRTRGVV